MYCRNCGKEMSENAAVCLSCGVNKNVGNKFCPNCGCETNENQAICVKCGVNLDEKNGNSSTSGNVTGGLYRSKEGKPLAGVCAGLAKKTSINAWILRIVFILFGFSLIGVSIYIGMAIALKYDDEA